MRRILLAIALAAAATLSAQSLTEFEKKITEFRLKNGLKFIVLENHQAPVVSFHTFVNAGSVDNVTGQAGLAHMFEHMAFKGTPTIGSKNWAAEKVALADIEKVYDELDQEKRKARNADKAKIAELDKKLKSAIEKANGLADGEEYSQIMQQNGAVNLNAGTGMDFTMYYVNYPANRLELWFLMESDRFLNTVFREFYKERDVVRQERRMSLESNPIGTLANEMLEVAFSAHPYKQTTIGPASDIEAYRVGAAKLFRETYYVPGNMTIAIAGDVDPKQVRAYAERYFGPMQPGPLPPPVTTVEPVQNGEKRFVVESPAQPVLLAGYKRPDMFSDDDPVFDVLDGILSGGRTGVMYKELVEKQKLALAAQAISSFPGSKYSSLYMFFIVPNAGKTIAEAEKSVYEILEKLKKEPVDEQTLKRVKTKVRAGLLRQLENNAGMAQNLAMFEALYGDWRKLFTSVEDIEKVTAADVMRVANKTFVEKNRTVGYLKQPAKEGKSE